MPSVKVRDNEPFDIALRRFKRSCEKAGVLAEVRSREFYEKPTQERKRKLAAAVKRNSRRLKKSAVVSSVFTKMSIRDSVNAAIKEAMRAKDKASLQTLRLISAAFKQIEVDQRIEISDEVATAELVRQVKQRQDAAKQFTDAGRNDLADNEQAEIVIIQQFLPEQMDEEAIKAHVDEALAASSLPLEMASMGPLMAQLKPQLQGKADMGAVSKYLRQKLQSS